MTLTLFEYLANNFHHRYSQADQSAVVIEVYCLVFFAETGWMKRYSPGLKVSIWQTSH